MLPIVFLQALYGTSIPISKFLLSLCPPFFLTGVRMVVAGIVLLFYKLFIDKEKFVFEKKHLWLYAQIILFGIYFKYLLRYWALSLLPAAKLSFMLNTTPFIAALFSFVWFGEKLTKKQWIGLWIGFLGLMPLLLLRTPKEALMGQLFFISWPEVAVFVAIACHTYGMVVARTLIRDHKSSAAGINGVRMLGGGILALFTAFFWEGFFPITDVGTFSIWLLGLVFISNIVCHSWYLRLLKNYSVTFISLTDFISPLTTAFYSWLFLKEAITWHYGVCAVTVFAGLYLFHQDELQVSSLQAQKGKA